MIKSREEMPPRRLEIDLQGPEGNAYALMALAMRLGRELGWEREVCEGIRKTMMFSDYEGLLITFDEFFGKHVTLYR